MSNRTIESSQLPTGAVVGMTGFVGILIAFLAWTFMHDTVATSPGIPRD